MMETKWAILKASLLAMSNRNKSIKVDALINLMEEIENDSANGKDVQMWQSSESTAS